MGPTTSSETACAHPYLQCWWLGEGSQVYRSQKVWPDSCGHTQPLTKLLFSALQPHSCPTAVLPGP